MNDRRKILSRGTALVDPRAAVERLRSFQLAEPLLYVLEIVRAAVAGGATAVDLHNDADDLVITFDGSAPSADDLAHLLDHLFSTAHPRLRLLALAVNTALGFGPLHVDLYTTHNAPVGQCHRVRFTAGVSHDPEARVPAALESARVELVPRPADLPAEGVRVHLRESFGLPVVREWFARDPAETVLLRDRLVALPIPLRRDGIPLVTGFVPAALVRVPLDLGADLHGSLQLLGPTFAHRLVLSELGVILEERPLAPTDPAVPAAPLRLHLDARALPTNASRSRVDLSGGLQHALRRAWNHHLPDLLAATRARLAEASLSDTERLSLHESLITWLHHDLGDAWPTSTNPADAAAPTEDLTPDDADLGRCPPSVRRALLAWPLVPTATGALVSVASIIAAPPALVWRGPEPLPADLASYLGAVLWCPPKRPRLDALLRPLSLQLAAIDDARDAQTRRQRFLGLTPRDPRVAHEPDEVLRAVFGEAATDDRPALPASLPGLRGEIVLRAHGLDGPGPLRVTVFVEQRPLFVEALDTAGVPAEVALEASGLRVNATFGGVERGATLTAALRAVQLVLAEVLAVTADDLAGALSLHDPRRQWFGPTLSELGPDTRRAMARAVFETLRAAAPDPAAALAVIRDALALHPSLEDLPLWPTTATTMLATTREVRAQSDALGARVLVSSNRGAERADGRPVLLFDPATQRTLAALLPAAVHFVDLTATLPTRITPDPRALVTLDDRRAVPWIVVASAHTRIALAPSPSTKDTLTLAHSGLALETRTHRGRFGPLQVICEDDRIIALPGKPIALPTSVPDDLDALIAAAEITLTMRLALAWQGDEDAADTLDADANGLRGVPARSLLLGALAWVTAHPEDLALQPLRKVLSETPMIPARRADGDVEEITPTAFRARIEHAGRPTFPFLAEAPADLVGEAFAPLIISEREHRALLEQVFAVKLRSAHLQLPALREARARRIAHARLGKRPQVRAEDLSGFAFASRVVTVALSDIGTLHAAIAREVASARLEVIVDGVVAFCIAGDALPSPVVGRLVLVGEASLTSALDALSDAGREDLAALEKAIVPRLLEAALDEAAEGKITATGVTALCLHWARKEGSRGLSAHPALRDRLHRAPLWRSPSGERISLATLTLFSSRPAWCRARSTPWVAAESGEEPDLAAVVLDQEDDAKGLSMLAGDGAIDRSDEIDRLQRRRALRASGGASVRCRGEPECAALSVRIESVAPKLGFGELRLVRGEPALTLRVNAPGGAARVLSLPAPFALAVALACADLDPTDVDRSVQSLELGTRLLEIARALLIRVASTTEEMPGWSDAALRWALLTSRNLEGAALGRALFADTAARPMSMADLQAQEATQRAVGYCTMVPSEPCALAEADGRAVVLSVREAGWLQTLRKGRDLTATVKLALRALAWERSPIAVRIEVPADESVRVRVRSALVTPGAEGEVCWLDDDALPASAVIWYRGRRRLGESALDLPWPARVALEAPELTPSPTCAGPVEDLALAHARQRATDLALGVLRRTLGPTEAEASLGCVAAHDPKSPAWRNGVTNAVGWLWLVADGAPGTLEARTGERSVALAASIGGKFAGAAPLAGRLWLRRGVRPGAERDELIEAMVSWAWRRLLDLWISAKGADIDNPAHAVLLTRAALAGMLTGATIRETSKTLRLPGTRTTFQQLQTARKDKRALRLVAPGDVRLERAYFVPAGRSPWMTVLAEAAMLEGDEVPTAAVPTARPEATRRVDPVREVRAVKESAAEGSWVARVEGELRAIGLPPEMLHALEVTSAARGVRKPMVDYDAETRVAQVAARHPVVAQWLAGDAGRGATLLAMAVYAAINRRRADVTWAEECAALDATLRALAARG